MAVFCVCVFCVYVFCVCVCVCVCVYENVSVFVQGELCFWFSRSCVWSGAGGLTEYSPYFIHQVLHEFILNLRASLKVWQKIGRAHV